MHPAELEIATDARCELIDITDRVREALARAGLRSGAVLVYSPHTTAGVTIQENADPDVQHDLLLALENAIPEEPPRGAYRHAEGNSPAHVKTALVGASQLVAVAEGELQLGTWQGIFLVEFDGPRRRKVLLRFLKDGA
jgi:secondary thiamine-phosphate synthase enzyme